jgi:hypothetical protein
MKFDKVISALDRQLRIEYAKVSALKQYRTELSTFGRTTTPKPDADEDYVEQLELAITTLRKSE